jgi:hypothetical protein
VGIAVNLTPHAIGELVARDAAGEPIYVVVIKASFSFGAAGRLESIPPQPIADLDRYAGDPASSGLLSAGDIGLPKPRVDVLFAGALKFGAPTADTVVRVEVGRRLDKQMRVFGDRFWLPGVASDLTASRPRPVEELPIAWERSAGGAVPGDPRLTDRRNPAGCTTGRTATDLEGKSLPNFEDPGDPTKAWKGRPTPCGLGPIAPHWEPRSRLAGTFDDRWREQRAPLLPQDFDPAFLNCAPVDQQLASYLPGEEVRLTGMTPSARSRFELPELAVPVTFVMRDLIEETRGRVDTIIIEPAEERVSLVARACCSPRPSAIAVREAFVGPLTRGRRRALELGKAFWDLRSLPNRPRA